MHLKITKESVMSKLKYLIVPYVLLASVTGTCLGSTVICPPTLTCTAAKTCTVPSGFPTSWIAGGSGVPGPGTYYFKSALMSITNGTVYNAEQVQCSYVSNNTPGYNNPPYAFLSLQGEGAIFHTSNAPYLPAISANWQPISNPISSGTSDQCTTGCAMTYTPPTSSTRK